jgi:hypothetical protein
MFIPVPNFSIPDPGSRVKKIPDPGSASKNLSILTIKLFLSCRENDLECSSRIPNPDFVSIPDPGVKKAPDPGSGSAALSKTCVLQELEAKMREAETDSHEGKRKAESLWPIFKIHHQVCRLTCFLGLFSLFRNVVKSCPSFFVFFFSIYNYAIGPYFIILF